MDVFLLLCSFAVILAGALFFTNAVEWFGHRISLGEGAVGSLLAAVGTAMPESLIPVVAIINGGEGAEDVAIGAIVGAPFLLATLGMLLVGTSARIFSSRREQGSDLKAHAPTLERDLGVFLVFTAIALLLGLGAPTAVQLVAAPLLVVSYGVYVWMTIRGGGAVQADDTLGRLYFDRRSDAEEPPTGLILVQLVVSLGAIFGGAHMFVEELTSVAERIGVDVLILSLILAPLATELPEKANSFFWVREGKDSLALGNITGAMVFQSMLPVAIGLSFTDWALDRFAVLSMALALGGGVVAILALLRHNRFGLPALLAWGGMYSAFVVGVALAA